MKRNQSEETKISMNPKFDNYYTSWRTGNDFTDMQTLREGINVVTQYECSTASHTTSSQLLTSNYS